MSVIITMAGTFYTLFVKSNRMEGKGKYKLMTGSIYDGDMDDGMWHGNGTLHFKDGTKYKGVFEKGHPISVQDQTDR